MPYILPDGNYYAATDFVATGSIEVDIRPANYVLKSGWQTDPMNAWRPKNQSELDAEVQAEEDSMAFPNVLLTIAKALHNHENRLRMQEGKPSVTLRQVIKFLRTL